MIDLFSDRRSKPCFLAISPIVLVVPQFQLGLLESLPIEDVADAHESNDQAEERSVIYRPTENQRMNPAYMGWRILENNPVITIWLMFSTPFN
jgi:hypothetical protein